jgi:trans-aconitate methyltransferase
MHRPAKFDVYAHRYEQALNHGLALSGESRTFFAEGRVRFLARCLRRVGFKPREVLDYGCGDGGSARLVLAELGAESLIGVDTSAMSVEVARASAIAGAHFESVVDFKPVGRSDLAYCNGIFHHIPLEQRPAVLARVHAALRPGGLFALWENNPWNPGTRLVMRRIPFDRDAVPLSAGTAKRMLTAAGFEVMRTDFLFIFPKALRWLRPLERPLRKAPLGAQYQVLSRRG